MPKLLVAATLSLVLPAVAIADDAAPARGPLVEIHITNAAPPPPAPVVADPEIAPVEPAPSSAELAPPSAVAPAVAPAEGRWCAERRASRWGAPAARRGRFAIGIAKGKVEHADDTTGRDVSLIARAQGRRGWGLELELSRVDLGADEVRTAGGSLYKAFGARRLAPYVIAGGGRGILVGDADGEQLVRFAEAGGGLLLHKRRLAIGVDVRRGVRRVDSPARADTMAAPPVATSAASVMPTAPERELEGYVRARIVAMIVF